MSLSFIIRICTRERINSFKISRKRCSPDVLTKLSSIAAASPVLLRIRNVYAKRHFCFLKKFQEREDASSTWGKTFSIRNSCTSCTSQHTVCSAHIRLYSVRNFRAVIDTTRRIDICAIRRPLFDLSRNWFDLCLEDFDW